MNKTDKTTFCFTRALLNTRYSAHFSPDPVDYIDDGSVPGKSFSFRSTEHFIDQIGEYADYLGMSKADFVRVAIRHAMATVDSIDVDLEARLEGDQ